MTQVVSVYLPSTVEYVTGTVNGAVTEWQYTGEKWQTIADRSGDDVYRVEITAYNTQGTSATYHFTLLLGLNLITDRTQTDVNYAQHLNSRDVREMSPGEVADMLSGTKGMYTHTDRNRVEAAVLYLSDLLATYGYASGIGTVKTDWTASTVYSIADINRYLNNVKSLRAAFYGTVMLPDTMIGIKHEEANNIERLLLEIERNINLMVADFTYSGEIYAGEDDWV